MESQNHSIRIITLDREDLITWHGDIKQPNILETLLYITFQIKKKHSTEDLEFVDIDNNRYTLEKILDFELSPVFILLPKKLDAKTELDVGPRTESNVYNFKDENTVKIQKFENLKKLEDVEMKISVMKVLNDANKKKNFEVEGDQAKSLAKREALANFNQALQLSNPTKFVSTAESNTNSDEISMTPEDLANDDMSKREKVHGNDGKSQWGFLNIFKPKEAAPVKNTGPMSYTLDDVKKHNRRQDAWMIVNSKVYDITQYIPFHPGGDKILAGVGRDGTELFNKYHPWVNADFLLAKYQVGFLKK